MVEIKTQGDLVSCWFSSLEEKWEDSNTGLVKYKYSINLFNCEGLNGDEYLFDNWQLFGLSWFELEKY